MMVRKHKVKKVYRKGVIARPFLIMTIIVLIFLTIALVFTLGYKKYIETRSVTDKCRITVMANSVVRFRSGNSIDEFLAGAEGKKERIPIECPKFPDLEIKYSDVKSKGKSDTARKFYIMRIIADEMKNCHGRYIGDVANVIPFGQDEGSYCGICRKISFDTELQSFLKIDPGNSESQQIDDFMTYLMNTRIPTLGLYYSEYLYGFKKDEASDDFSFNQLVEDNFEGETQSNNVNLNEDFIIDPLEEYYVVHYVYKGVDPYLERVEKALFESNNRISNAVIRGWKALWSSASTSAWGAAKESYMNSYKWVSPYNDGDEKTLSYIRITTIIPADSLAEICEVRYGMETYKGDEE